MLQSANAEMKVKPQEGVVLTAEASLEPTALTVKYRVTNGTAQAIVLWDQMIGYDDQGEKLDPHAAYVFLEKPQTVRLVRAQLELPPNVDIYRKEIPYVRTVAAHASAEGVVRLTLPLHEASPFYSPPEFWDYVACNKVKLVLGWRELLPGMKLVAVTLHGTTVHIVQGRWEPPPQHLLETTLDVATGLKTRRDEFDRRMPMN